MNYSQVLRYFVAGAVAVGLAGCANNKQTAQNAASGGDFAQKTISPQAKNYAFQGNSRYTDQVERNPYGGVKNALVAPANQTYYFDLDSNIIATDDYEALAIQANYLASHPKAKIRLEGNTDNRGSREYNIALGWRRDQSVEKFLEQHGVMRSQIEEVSYGKERPAVEGNSEDAWHLNRRVELKYEVK